jgi:hypothetical protein
MRCDRASAPGGNQSPSGHAVTSMIFGGLGNQMFQFAAGRRLALNNGAALVLDKSRSVGDNVYKRDFALGHFALPQCAVVDGGDGGSARTLAQQLRRKASQLIPLRARRVIIERSGDNARRLLALQLRRSVTLDGHWQDEAYFHDIAGVLRSELQFVNAGSFGRGTTTAAIGGSRNSVAVHVRRLHDVRTGPEARPRDDAVTKGYALAAAYYARAFDYIASRCDSPSFFVFSDYEEWAIAHLPTNDAVRIVRIEQRPDYEDLWLMTQCKHHVIANSSFSWWGAWLAEKPGSIVVAPNPASCLHAPRVPPRWVMM